MTGRRTLTLVSVFALGAFLCVKFALAAVTVTPATGGTNISADTAANAASPAWTTLGDIVVTEAVNTDFAANQTNTTLILTAPTNWQFNTAAGSVGFTGGRDITAASLAVAASTLTVTLSTDNNANRTDALTISGIQVRPVDGALALPSSGNILRTAANPGTATIAGIVNGTTNFGSLSMAAGTARLQITSVNGGANPTAGTAFAVVVRSQDQFGHLVNRTAATGVSLSLNTGTGTLGGTLTGTIAAGGNSATINGVTYTRAESGVILNATRTSGDVIAAGTSSAFTVNPGALANFLVEAAGGGNIATQTAGTSFNVRVTARDANGNTVTSFTGAGNTVDITSSGTLSAGGGTSATFTNGVLASHAVTVSNTGSFTITATRTAGGAQTGTSNSFTVNPGALANFLVEAAGGGNIATQTAGTSFNVRVTARDANGNTVTSFTGAGNTVDVTSTGTLSGGNGTTATFTNGVLASHTVTLSNTGSFTITATRTSGGAQTGTSNSFAVNAGALANFLVEAAGGGNVADQTAGTSFDIRVTARDSLGNTVTSFTGPGNTVNITSTGTLSAGGGTTSTFTNGVLSSHAVTVSNTGGFTITATRTSGGAQTGTSNSFTVAAGALSSFLVEAAGGGNIAAQTAGASFNLRVTARDANGNTVTSFSGAASTVDITSTGTLSAGNGTTATFTNGVLASHAVTISNTGSFTVTATRTTGGSENGTSNSFTVSPGALANFLVEAAGGGSIATQTAGTSFNVRVTARDANGNTVTGFTGAGSTVDITSTGTIAAGGGTTATFTNGVLSSHAVTVSNTGSFTITATRTSGGAQTGTSSSFAVNAGALANFLVEAAGGGNIPTQTAGSSFNVRVTARDVNGNTVTSFSGAGSTVDVTSTGTLSSGGGTTGTFTNGVLASHAVTISNTGSFTITATRTSGGAQTGTSGFFTVDPGALDHFVVDAAGGGAVPTQTAGQSFDIRVRARDALDNTVTSFTGTVEITSTGTLTAGGGTTVAFTAGVLSSHSVTLSNTGSFTLTATRTSGGAQTGTSGAFTVDPGALDHFAVDAVGGGAIGTQTAGSSFNVRVRAQDNNNNTVTGFTGTVDISSTGTLAAGNGTTAAFTAGVLSSHSVTISNTGAFTITATRTSGGAQTGTSAAFTVDAGALDHFEVEAAGGGNIAGQTAGQSFNVRIRAKDGNDNVVTGFSSTVDITSTGTLGSGAGTTAAFTNGVLASHAVTITNTGSFTVSATRTSGGFQTGTSNAFGVDPGALDHFAVEAAGGGAIPAQTAGLSFDVRVRAQDANNNTVTGFTGTVDISSTGALSQGSGTTAVFTNGVLASHAVTVSNSGSFTISATRTSGGAQSGTSNSFSVNAAVLDHFDVVATGGGAIGTQTAGQAFGVRIVAKDASNNTVTTFAGTADVTASGTLSSGSGTTAAFTNGVLASHSVTITNTGSFTITATRTSGGSESGTSASFTVDAGAIDHFAVDAAGGGAIGTQTAGTPFNVRVRARDAFNNVVTGFAGTVDITSDGNLGAGGGTTATFTNGVLASHSVTFTNTGSFTITATRTSGGSQSGTSGSFTVDPGALDHFAVDAASGGAIPTQTAGQSFDVRVRAQDANNNTVTGFTGTVDISSDGTVSAGGGTTAAFSAGVLASHAVTITNTGSFAITATRTSGGAQAGTSASFTVNAGALDHFAVDAAGGGAIGTQAAGQSFDVRIRARDAFNNLVTGFTGTVDITSTGTVSNGGGTTGAFTAGILSAHAVTITNTGSFTITATRTSGGAQTGTSAAFTVDPGSLDHFDVDAAGGGALAAQTAGQSFNVRVRARDAFENLVTGFTGTVDVTSDGNVGAGGGTTAAFSAGVLSSHAITITNTGSFAITATRTSGGAQTGTSGSFTVDPGALDHFDVDAAGGGAIATQTAGSPFGIRVRAKDALDNVVTGFTGTVDVTSTGTLSAGSGTTPAFTNGVLASHSVTISKTGSFTVTATRTSGGAQSGVSGAFTVDPGAASRLVITAVPSAASVGNTFSVTVQTRDANDNVAPVALATDVELVPSGTGTLGGRTTTIGAGSSSGTLNAVTYDTIGSFTLVATRTSGDTLSDSLASSPIDVKAEPTAALAFPGASSYNAAAWAAGCTTAGFCGAVTDDSGTGIDDVEVSIRRGSGNYWDGSGFSSASEIFVAASVAGGNWSYAFSATSFPADGTYSVRVRATDNLGGVQSPPVSRTFDVDATAPSSAVTFPTSGSTYRTATWNDPTGSASDAAALDRVEVSVRRVSSGLYWNGSAFAAGTENWVSAAGTASWSLAFAPASFAADGDYVFRVRAVDAAGNVEAPSSYTVTLDQTAPETTIDSAPSANSNDESPQFVFSSEPGATFMCRLDAGAFAPCTSPVDYSSLSESAHTFQVRATDAAGNTDPSPAARTWTLDRTAPTSTFSFPANGGSYNTAGWSNPSGNASDAGGTAVDRVDVSLRSDASGLYWNGTAFASATEDWLAATGGGPWSLSFAASGFPADGNYTIRVRAVDTAGNVETPSARTFTVDTVAPETSVDGGPSGDVSATNATFTFSADQPGATFECRLDNGPWEVCASPMSYGGPLAEGIRTFDVRAGDAGGNTDATPATRTWRVDTVGPVVSMNDPGLYLRDTVVFTADATDTGGSGISGTSFQKSPAGAGTWTAVPASWPTTPADDALYDFRATATDNAGNVATSSVLTGIRVDNTAPTAVLDDPGAAVGGTVGLTQSSTDGGSGLLPSSIAFEYRKLPAGAWTPTPAAWNTTTLPDGDGSYELRVRVEDRAGNTATSTARTTVVDNIAPSVAFTSPVDGGFVNGSAADPYTLTATASDTGSGVEQVEFFDGSTSLGVDTSAPYEASWAIGVDGPETLKAVASDQAGHDTEVEVTITIDRTLPDTTLTSNPGTPSNVASPPFSFTSSETGSTFECRIDGGTWSECTSGTAHGPLSDGNHTFDVRAVDAAGNGDSTPASWTWLVDTTPPAATIDDPGANLRGNAVPLGSTQSDGGSGIAAIEYQYSVADADNWVGVSGLPWNTLPVTDGLYDVRVVVADNAGNVTESAAVEDRRIDNSPPTTSLASPAANVRSTITLDGAASDSGSGVALVEFEYSVDGTSFTTIPGSGVVGEPFDYGFDTTSLPDGLYFFRTKATDVAGNTATGGVVGPIRIDNTLPAAIMDDPGQYLRGTKTLTSTATDVGGSGVDTVVYHYTGPAIGTTSGTWVTNGVADGLYDVHVVVTDLAGNVATSAVVAGRHVDNTKPTTAHNAPGGWQSSAVTVGLAPSDGGSGVANTQFSVDGGGWQSGTSVSVSGDGVHTISFFSTDNAGNVESPGTATVSIDTTPPDPGALDPGNYLRGTVTLGASPNNGGSGADVAEVEFQHKRSSSGTWASLGIDADAPYSAAWATTPADDGSWDLRFIARDDAVPTPNESVTDLASKIVDNTAPTGNVSSPLNGSTVSGNVTLGVSASDANPIASVEYFVGGSSVGSSSSTPYQVTWSSASGADGPRSIHAVISDMAGNTHTTGAVGVTVDNFAPTVNVSALSANVSGTVALTATASGDTVSVAYEARLLPGGGWSSIGSAAGGPWTVNWTPGADGQYEVRATATDAGANSGVSPAVTTRVDNTDPTGMLTEPNDGNTLGGSAATLSATASDAGSGVASVQWQASPAGASTFGTVASDTGAPYGSTWDVTSVASGGYDLQIVVTDAAGNTFTSPTVTVVVDSLPPSVALDNPGSPVSGNVALTTSVGGDHDSVTFSRSPAGASTWTTISTDNLPPYAASFNTASVADGAYDLRAVVRDAVGNTSQSIVAGVVVDNSVPVLASSSPANGAIVASASQIVLTASEPLAAVENAQLDGAAAPPANVSGNTATLNTGALANGPHTLTGTLRDAAGTTTSFTISFVIGVSTPPPAAAPEAPFDPILPLVSAPANLRGVLETDGTLTLRWAPPQNADGELLATVLLIDGLAVQSFRPGEDSVNLGAFDPADLRVFSLATVGRDGQLSAASAKLRSSSALAGKSVEEATSILVSRGFQVGEVTGVGTTVVSPERPLMAELGSTIDLELGGGPPQARLIFNVVGTRRVVLSKSRSVSLRVQTTRAAQVSAVLLSPRGDRAYRWRFAVKAGASIRQITLPPRLQLTGRYRIAFTVTSGPQSVKKTIVVQIVKNGKVSGFAVPRQPVEIVLAGDSAIPGDLAADLGGDVRLSSAETSDEAWLLTGNTSRNVQVVVVDVDRYGLALVRDLHKVFPGVRILALTNDPRLLAQSVRVGAALAAPRSTPASDLAKLIRRLAAAR